MNIPELAVRRSVTVFMIVIGILVLGFVSLSRLSLDLLPDITYPVAVVTTDYPGAGPEEIEESVTRPLEEVLSTLNNVDTITSDSQTGSSMVVLQFDWGTDMDFATIDMREKIDMIRGMLPEDAGDPMVMKMDPSMMPVLQIGLSGGRDLAELTRLAEDEIKPRLERLPGAAWVVVTGGRTREVQVLVDPVKLDSYGLSLSQVAQVLGGENIGLSAGTLEQGKKEFLVTTSGEYSDLLQLANTPLTTPGGAVVYLKDISEIKQGYSDLTQKTSLNGRPSVGVHVLKQSGANTVQVSRAVQEELGALQKELPGEVKAGIIFDQADYIRESVNTVVNHALLGAILAVVVIFLFLRNFRSTVIIGISIPISIIATFVMMYFGGLTLNLLSLGGLAMGVGMIVDDSIVVLESIYRYREAGCSAWEAVTAGAQEVAMAVTSSTLTNVIIFLPVVFVQGIASQVFRDLALTVTFALLASLLVAMTLVPVLAHRLVRVTGVEEQPHTWFGRLNSALGRFFDAVNTGYRGILDWALGRRKAVVGGTVAIFILSLCLLPLIGAEFFPEMDSGEISINVKMPRGTGLNGTGEVAGQVEEICGSIPEVETIFTSVGSSAGMGFFQGADTDRASVRVKLVPRQERHRSTAMLVEDLRSRLGEIPGAEIEVKESEMVSLGTSPVSITLEGDDLDVLEAEAGEIARVVEKVPGTRNVATSLEEGKQEIEVRLRREGAASYGLSTTQVAQVLRTAISGQVVTTYRGKGEECDLRVRLAPGACQSLDDLANLSILTPGGALVPLREVADLNRRESPVVVSRENQTRVCYITADVQDRPLGSVMKDIQSRLDRHPLPPGYRITYGGESREMTEAFGSLTLALVLGILLVYMVMASQFESLFNPFVIMFTMPLAFIGVVWAFVFTGMSFSISAFIGVIMLAGIVVKNGIVLVDYINTLRRRGMNRREAILKAGPVRLRPVLMTALTAIFGMVPLALGAGEGGEMNAPLAVAVIGGLTVATFLTLVVVPVMYTLLEDLGERLVPGIISERRERAL